MSKPFGQSAAAAAAAAAEDKTGNDDKLRDMLSKIVNSITVEQCQELPCFQTRGCEAVFFHNGSRPWASFMTGKGIIEMLPQQAEAIRVATLEALMEDAKEHGLEKAKEINGINPDGTYTKTASVRPDDDSGAGGISDRVAAATTAAVTTTAFSGARGSSEFRKQAFQDIRPLHTPSATSVVVGGGSAQFGAMGATRGDDHTAGTAAESAPMKTAGSAAAAAIASKAAAAKKANQAIHVVDLTDTVDDDDDDDDVEEVDPRSTGKGTAGVGGAVYDPNHQTALSTVQDQIPLGEANGGESARSQAAGPSVGGLGEKPDPPGDPAPPQGKLVFQMPSTAHTGTSSGVHSLSAKGMIKPSNKSKAVYQKQQATTGSHHSAAVVGTGGASSSKNPARKKRPRPMEQQPRNFSPDHTLLMGSGKKSKTSSSTKMAKTKPKIVVSHSARGTDLHTFATAKEAGKALNIQSLAIQAACRNGQSVDGYKFRFAQSGKDSSSIAIVRRPSASSKPTLTSAGKGKTAMGVRRGSASSKAKRELLGGPQPTRPRFDYSTLKPVRKRNGPGTRPKKVIEVVELATGAVRICLRGTTDACRALGLERKEITNACDQFGKPTQVSFHDSYTLRWLEAGAEVTAYEFGAHEDDCKDTTNEAHAVLLARFTTVYEREKAAGKLGRAPSRRPAQSAAASIVTGSTKAPSQSQQQKAEQSRQLSSSFPAPMKDAPTTASIINGREQQVHMNSVRMLESGVEVARCFNMEERGNYLDAAETMCIVCQVNPTTIVLQPCGHCVLCLGCSESGCRKFCPVCRTPIAARVQPRRIKVIQPRIYSAYAFM